MPWQAINMLTFDELYAWCDAADRLAGADRVQSMGVIRTAVGANKEDTKKFIDANIPPRKDVAGFMDSGSREALRNLFGG